MESLWKSVKTPEGKEYFYNTQTKATSWSKPDEAQPTKSRDLSAREEAIVHDRQPWRLTGKEGTRKYYFHAVTRATQWDEPEEYRLAVKSLDEGSATLPQTDYVAGGGSGYGPQRQQRPERNDYRPADRGPDRPQSHFQDRQNDGYRPSFASAATEQSYANPEAAEKAFKTLLSQSEISSDWEWERAMKDIIKNPEYRAIGDPRKRKRAFETWSTENAALQKEKAKERQAKAREDFMKMLKSHPEIKHYTRWPTIRPILEGEAMFKATENEAERRQFFFDFLKVLQAEFIETEALDRKNHLAELSQLLRQLDIGLLTTWEEAKQLLGVHNGVLESGKFKSLHEYDVLTTFEQHMKTVEEAHDHVKQMEKFQRKRQERQNRDAYERLLSELIDADKMNVTSKWMEIVPLIDDDPRYDAMLGQEGSSAQELFFDLIAKLKESLLKRQQEVEEILKRHKFRLEQSTTIEDFNAFLDRDPRTAKLIANPNERASIFADLHAKAVQKDTEDRYAREKDNRRRIDALRSYIKHLEPRVRLGDTYESIRPLIEDSNEYRALRHSEDRRAAFDKHMRRLAEKEDLAEQERSRRDRDRERDRHRDRPARVARYSRSVTPNGGRLTPPRSAGVDADAYEADRKKAQANRERVYNRSSRLSPPPPRSTRRSDRERERERESDRYEHIGRPERRVSASRAHGDRNGPRSAPLLKTDLDRETERDQASAHRALDYGDEGASGGGSSTKGAGARRRRDLRSGSESEGAVDGVRRDSKRLKRDDKVSVDEKEADEATAAAKAKAEKEEEHLVSGSEEGEIEIEEAS